MKATMMMSSISQQSSQSSICSRRWSICRESEYSIVAKSENPILEIDHLK